MEKNICLVNIKIKKNIELEFFYSESQEISNVEVFFEDFNKNKINGKILKSDCIEKDGNINYKIIFELDYKFYGRLAIKIENDGKKYDAKILNNKNEEILEEDNKYKIFANKYIIEIKKDYIEIKNKKFLEKLNYEIFKQIYAIKKYKKIAFFRLLKGKNKYYLFNDRLMFGDDNAEELFKYISENEKEFAKKSYFVLDKEAKCFDRLSKYGKVIKYGSFSHKIKFLNCKIVISSHASYYDNCFNPFNETEMKMYKDLITKQFAFIQHGVAMNDIHKYTNRCRIIADLYTVSTHEESKYIKIPRFMYEEDAISMTGLPRFDRLKNEDKNCILISPTWRENLSDKEYEGTGKKGFLDSEYFRRYKSLLNNPKLMKILNDNNYYIKFLLHPVFNEKSDLFSEFNSENVKVLKTKDIRYSDLFNECSIFITDYSSIHFDVATLKKPILYYQYDREEFLKNHYEKGYFDYDRDCFGEIVVDEEKLIELIEKYILNNCKIEQKYSDRIDKTFLYLDKNNSKRTFEDIIKLENKKELNYRFNNTH